MGPLLPVFAAAERRGDEVLVVAPDSLRHYAADAGLAFRAGAEPAESEIAPIRQRLPVAPLAEATILGNRDLFGRLAARAMLPAMTDTVTGWKPDLVIREPCEYASAALAVQYGIATAQVAISPAGSEHGSIRAAAPALEELHPGLPEQLMAGAYLTRFPASLDPSPFPTTIRYRAPTQPPVALPDWWSGSDRPLVYVSFGSVFGHLSGAVAAYRAVLSAVAPLPVRVLLTTGRHHVDAAALGPQPRNVHVRAWVDQVDALTEADLIVCHGGSGTALGALEAGVPLVVTPAYGDQVTNAHHIADAGAGLAVEIESRHEHGRLVSDRDAPRITAAVQTLLSDSSFRSAARAISAEMATTPLIDDTLAELATGLP